MLLYVWKYLLVRLPRTPEEKKISMLDSGKSISSQLSHHSMQSVGSEAWSDHPQYVIHRLPLCCVRFMCMRYY